MLNFLRHFWKTIGAFVFLLGVYWAPKNVQDWRDAAEPWQRFLAMVDQSTALWIFAVLISLWLFWSELRPLMRGRFSSGWGMRPVKGMYPAKLVFEFDKQTGKPRRLENRGLARFYVAKGNPWWIFLAFERDTGTESVIVRSNDGSPVSYDIMDSGLRSLVIKVNGSIPFAGLSIECEYPRDPSKLRVSTHASVLLPNTEEKMQPKTRHG